MYDINWNTQLLEDIMPHKALLKHLPEGVFYYAGCDTCICLATGNVEELAAYCLKAGAQLRHWR